MRLKICQIILVCVFLAGVSQVVWGHAAGVQTNAGAPGILGHLDPRTGAFTPLQQTAEADLAALILTAPTTGKFVFSFTITIASTNLGSDAIACEANVTALDTSGHTFTETASVAATKSGTTATCTVTIPYSWILSTPTVDMVSLAYTISAVNTAAASGGQPTRISSQTLGTIKVPATGLTTTETLKATI